MSPVHVSLSRLALTIALQRRYIACGARHSCAIDERGEVFCWGWSLHGQCGSALPSVRTPTKIDALNGIEMQQISAGLAHTLALSRSGDAYR